MRHDYTLKSSCGRFDVDGRSVGHRTSAVCQTRPIGVVCKKGRGLRWEFVYTILEPQRVVPPRKTYLNRGFGGSQISDSIANVDLLILKHQPRIVVFYAGDNDIAAGKGAERVASDFAELTKRVHATLSQTKILFIAIKPSLARWNMYDRMATANELIRGACNADIRLTYIDIATAMLDSGGRPDSVFFVSDGLHLSASGYRLWTQLVKPYLD